MRYDSSYADLDVRDAEISAHAAFRRRLCDHDVVPEAQPQHLRCTKQSLHAVVLTAR
ncbi:hypothetical protein [Bradyrhizobium retamae]|uniref:hypothetical protein n=1 Tax=Bradyrhizobium retamae TaxID=1300035 RepID=UPI000AC87292|nr:hypothetical protein [Bradyrhizobium retamae]